METKKKKPSHIRRLIQIFSSEIFEGDVVVRNDRNESYIVKSVVGDTITVQDKNHKNVEIAMSVKNVKKAKFLSYIKYDSLEEDYV